MQTKLTFLLQARSNACDWQLAGAGKFWTKFQGLLWCVVLMQVAALLQMGRLHEASKLALKSGNRQTVRLVLDEGRKLSDDSVVAECQSYLRSDY